MVMHATRPVLHNCMEKIVLHDAPAAGLIPETNLQFFSQKSGRCESGGGLVAGALAPISGFRYR